MNFEFSTSQTVWMIILVAIVVVAIIIIGRLFFNSRKGLKEKYENKKFSSPLIGRNKYPDVDSFKSRNTVLLFGLLASLAITFVVFNWTVYETKMDYSSFDLEVPEDIEIEVPRTAEPPPPPPPPPPPVIEEVPEEEILEDDVQEFASTDVEADDVIEEIPEDTIVKEAPKAPPPPKKKVKKEIFKIVEQMPRFPGCEDKPTKAEKEKCAQAELYKFIYEHLKYPTIAQENGIEGKVFLRFAVDDKGKVSQVTILRDIGGNCGEAAAKVIRKMNDSKTWIPGRQGGRKVSVWYTLPIVFKLTG